LDQMASDESASARNHDEIACQGVSPEREANWGSESVRAKENWANKRRVISMGKTSLCEFPNRSRKQQILAEAAESMQNQFTINSTNQRHGRQMPNMTNAP